MSTEVLLAENNQDATRKKFQWSQYSFFINLICLTMFNGLIVLLMIMHRTIDPLVVYGNRVIILVAIFLEIAFGIIAFLDSMKRNPIETMFNARMFNMPIFVIVVSVIIAIFWNRPDTFAIVYGGISGGFAGYLAGALAYANFFIKVKDVTYRTILGGWIGVSIGGIAGAILAYLIDPIGGGIFGGIFMGFWGGAIISGPLATVCLSFFENNFKFTNFFIKLHIYNIYKKINPIINRLLDDAINNKDDTIISNYIEQNKLLNPQIDNGIIEEKRSFMLKIKKVFFRIIFLFNPWILVTEEDICNSYRDIYGLPLSERYLISLSKSKHSLKINYKSDADSGGEIRQIILKTLGQIPEYRAKKNIVYALHDPNFDVVYEAVFLAGKLKLIETTRELKAIFVGSPTGFWDYKSEPKKLETLAENAREALGKLEEKLPSTISEILSFKLIYTKKEQYESITELIGNNIILTSDDIIALLNQMSREIKTADKYSNISSESYLEVALHFINKLSSQDFNRFISIIDQLKKQSIKQQILKNLKENNKIS